jgi:hypothetical protein
MQPLHSTLYPNKAWEAYTAIKATINAVAKAWRPY